MKISEMSPEQHREYNKLAKRKEREKLAAKIEAAAPVLLRLYRMPETQSKKLAEHVQEIKSKILAELGLPDGLWTYRGGASNPDGEIVDLVACCVFGLENGYVQKVQAPEGVLWGGYFPEEAASDAVWHVHTDNTLLKSETFKALYDKLIKAVSKKFPQSKASADARAELAGTYVLPVPEVKPVVEAPAPVKSIEPVRVAQPPRPTPNHITFTWDGLSPEAQRYVEGRR
jgi:hypothetical protein